MEGSVHGVISMYIPGIWLEGLQKAMENCTLVKCSRFKLDTSQTQVQIITSLAVEQDE
jgi:hypothetical protein